MKSNKTYLIEILTFITLTGLTSPSGATGTIGGGGGHDSEILVKEAIKKSPEILLNMPDAALEKLKFDPAELLMKVDQIGVLCATDESLKPTGYDKNYFLNLGKQAYVFADYPAVSNTIFIDCEKYKINDWRIKTDLNEPKNLAFFTHEIIRTIPSLNKKENTRYFLSKSIFDAKKEENEIMKRAVATLFNYSPKENNLNYCKVNFGSSNSTGFGERFISISIWKNKERVFSQLLRTSWDDIPSKILMGGTIENMISINETKINTKFLYDYMKIMNCSNLDNF